MWTEMPIAVQHVSLEEKSIGIWLLAPVIVADLFEDFSNFASDGQIPVVRAETYVLQRIPDILAKASVLEETPILVFAQQAVRRDGLRVRGGCHRKPYSYPHEGDSHNIYFCVSWISA